MMPFAIQIQYANRLKFRYNFEMNFIWFQPNWFQQQINKASWCKFGSKFPVLTNEEASSVMAGVENELKPHIAATNTQFVIGIWRGGGGELKIFVTSGPGKGVGVLTEKIRVVSCVCIWNSDFV